jgi:hypothetical protein
MTYKEYLCTNDTPHALLSRDTTPNVVGLCVYPTG